MSPLLLVLALACTKIETPVTPAPDPGGGGGGAGGGTGTATPEDTGIAGPGLPHVDAPETVPTWTAAEVGAALETALAAGLPDPRYEHDQYLELLSHGNADCPGHETYIDDRFVYGCNAASGYYFSGVSNYLTSDETVDGVRTTEVEVNGDFMFRDDEEHFFEVGGHAIIRTTLPTDGSSGARWLEHSGTWMWQAHESWLREGASGRFSMSLTKAGADRVLGIEGAIGFGGAWMAFDHVVLAEGACAWAPTGAVEVRDPGGAWHRIDFGESCTPCAEVVFDRDTPLGEVCVDLSAVPLALGDGWEGL